MSSRIRRVDRLADRFEAAWRAGQSVRIEDYLAEVGEDDRSAVLRELLVVEMQLRSEQGDQWEQDEYRQRFPTAPRDVSAAFVLAEDNGGATSGIRSGVRDDWHSWGSSSGLLGHVSGTDRPDETAVDDRQPVPRFGRFELIERLGAGGFGTVWKAQDTVLKRMVALKIPRASRAYHGDASHLLREARSAARLKHPAVVQVFDAGVENGVAYICSEYVAGHSLRQHLQQGKLTHRRAAEICRQIAEALVHAHEMGIVHRDLKPGNILLDEAGNAYVADFGVAKTEEWDAPAGQTVGTAGYMAPEQASGRNDEIDGRADIYSLGVILYEMLTERRLFSPGSCRPAAEVRGVEAPLRRFGKDAPRDLQAICAKCLRPSPAERYQTAGALAAEFDQFLRGDPVAARPLWFPQRLIRWVKRRPATAAWTALSLVLLAAMVVLAAVGYRHTAQALEEAEAHLYFHRVISADRAWRANDMTQFHRMLEECPPGLRHWEHGFLRDLPNATALDLQSAGGSVAFHPHDLQLATGGGPDQRLKFWHADTGERQAALFGHHSHIMGIDYSRDGYWVATAGGHDRTATLWRVAHRKRTRVYQGHTDTVVKVRFLPDSRRLITVAQDKTLRFWDIESNEPLSQIELDSEHVRGLTVNGDGTLVAACLELDSLSAKICVWDIESRELVWELPVAFRTAGLAFSPDGPYLAVAIGRDSLRIWDIASRTIVREYPCSAASGAYVAYSGDGQRIAVSCWDGTVAVFDTGTGQQVLTLRGHEGQVREIALSARGEKIAFGTSENRVHVHNMPAEQGMGILQGHEGRVVDLAFVPATSWLVSASLDGSVRIWDAATHRELHVLARGANPVRCVSASPDGQMVAAGGAEGWLRIWDVPSGQLRWQLPGDGNPVWGLAFHPDGRELVSVSSSGLLICWDVGTGKALRLSEIDCCPRRRIVFSTDGKWLAVVAKGKSVRVLSTSTFCEKWRFTHEADTRSVAFTHDGQLATTTNDGTVSLWNLATGRIEWSLPGVQKMREADLVFHPDGSRFVLLRGGQDLTLWDYRYRQRLLTLREHADLSGHAVRFSSDGAYLATPRIDGSICIWQSPNGHD
jgi:eukaryotic-like serine/threonine-protein kinase